MKFTVDRQLLASAITNVSKAVSPKNAIQSLEGILVKVKKDTIVLCGYDLEFSISTVIDSVNEGTGEIVLPAGRFCDMVKRLATDKITVDVDEKCLITLTGGNTVYTILGIPALDFPTVPEVSEEQCVEVDSLTLKNMIDRSIFAVSEDLSRLAYTGVLFDFEKDKISLVGVDGFRMAVRSEKIKNDIINTLIVPAKTLREITKLMEEEEGVTSIFFTLSKICFKIGRYTIYSRLIKGEFFDYKKAVPTQFTTTFEMERRILSNSLDRLSLIVIERLKNPIRCEIKDHAISMRLNTTIGKASDTLDCDYQGDDLYIGFNCKYMLEAIRACESEKIEVKFSGPLSPIIITPKGRENSLFLVLPVRVK